MGRHAYEKPKSKNRFLVVLTALSLTGIVGAGATVASFTSSAESTINIQAGTIGITAPASLNSGIDKWYPGATSTVQTIDLKNTGDLPITVSMETTGAKEDNGGIASKLKTTMTNASDNTAIGAANQIAKDAEFSGLIIPVGHTVTINVVHEWVSVSNADDNSWTGKTDDLTYTFNAVNS